MRYCETILTVRILKEVISIFIVKICTDEVCICDLYSFLAQIHEVGVKLGLSTQAAILRQ